MADLPALDDTRCSASAVCVAICPTNCLGFTGGRPWLPRPADCISCTLCVLMCPNDALRMLPVAAEK